MFRSRPFGTKHLPKTAENCHSCAWEPSSHDCSPRLISLIESMSEGRMNSSNEPNRASSSAVERPFHMRKAEGSNPSSPTTFWKGVAIRSHDQCWPWLKSKNNKGYGRVVYQGREWKAHRLAFTLAKGPIPEGLCVRHKCDYPACCNPMHLRLGTIRDNNHDCIDRGRHIAPRGVRNGNTKLTLDDVRQIRTDKRQGVLLATEYGVSQSQISQIRSGKRWAWL